jgi:hypothetical protein
MPSGDEQRRAEIGATIIVINQRNRTVSYHGWVTWAAAAVAVAIVVLAGVLAGAFRRRRRRPEAITPEGFRRALDAMSPDARRGGEDPAGVPTSVDPRRVRIAETRRPGTDMPEQEGG